MRAGIPMTCPGIRGKTGILSNRPIRPFIFMPFSLTSEQKQAGLWLTLGLLLMALLILLGPVLTPFIAAAILAYALNPGVDWLAARRIGGIRMPRAIAVL